MDKKTFYNAICKIDESQLNEFEDNCKNIKKRRKIIKGVISFSSCFVIFAAGILIVKGGVFSEKPQIAQPQTTVTENEELVTRIKVEKITQENPERKTEKTNPKRKFPDESEEKTTAEKITEKDKETNIKGGDTPYFIQKHELGPDGVSYYEVFWPATDKFNPLEDMTLEKRFSSFKYNGKTYHCAPNGEITSEDYEPEILQSERALHYELRSPGEKVAGIVYAARVDIYKLKGIDTSEAIACVISFMGETKEYKYIP